MEFAKYRCDVSADRFGNVIACKKGKQGGGKLMFAAHMDEIGLMVSQIDEQGFLKFSPIGGCDQRTLLSQEVIVHGRRDVFGVIGLKPPHLTSDEEQKKSVSIADMAIDIGFSQEEAEPLVRVGDIVTVRRKTIELRNDLLSGKSLDDKAGVAALLECAKNLVDYENTHDLYFAATAQKEAGIRGARAAAFNVNPDICVVVDAGFAKMPGLDAFSAIELGKGPAIAVGPNIRYAIFEVLKETAEKNEIMFQIDPIPGMSYTDAMFIQIAGRGVATGLISLPLKYMHTSVETVSMKDVTRAGTLLSCFTRSLNSRDLEMVLCS
ncbi:MAG: M42 family peptidase [Clostridiales bacterium]|jgi:endoglucanase|nr:M42 family peptidase [Clostridiales bacterium]